MQKFKKILDRPVKIKLLRGGNIEIFKIFFVSMAARLYLFLISDGGPEIFKIFPVSAAAAAQPIGLHL
jgi:hypothetical protein